MRMPPPTRGSGAGLRSGQGMRAGSCSSTTDTLVGGKFGCDGISETTHTRHKRIRENGLCANVVRQQYAHLVLQRIVLKQVHGAKTADRGDMPVMLLQYF